MSKIFEGCAFFVSFFLRISQGFIVYMDFFLLPPKGTPFSYIFYEIFNAPLIHQKNVILSVVGILNCAVLFLSSI